MPEDDGIDNDIFGDADDESEVLPCPSCRQPVHEDTDKCPHCGDWIMPLAASAARPLWVRVVGAIVVVALLFGVIRALLRSIG